MHRTNTRKVEILPTVNHETRGVFISACTKITKFWNSFVSQRLKTRQVSWFQAFAVLLKKPYYRMMHLFPTMKEYVIACINITQGGNAYCLYLLNINFNATSVSALCRAGSGVELRNLVETGGQGLVTWFQSRHYEDNNMRNFNILICGSRRNVYLTGTNFNSLRSGREIWYVTKYIQTVSWWFGLFGFVHINSS